MSTDTKNPGSTGGKGGADGVQNVRENKRGKDSTASIANATGDIVETFRRAMAESGIVTDDRLLADGVLHRFHIEGHRRGTLNGAYVLHLSGIPAGWFRDFVSGAEGTWRLGGTRWNLDAATRRQIDAERAERQAEREAKQAQQAGQAQALWGAALPCDSHPYLERKRAGAHGVRLADGPWLKWHQDDAGRWRQLAIDGALLVPLRDEHGELWNLQAIFPARVPELGRDKDFLGGRKAGLFHTIGEPTETVCIAEGYATAATIFEQSGHCTFVAFDAGNLLAVAKTVRRLHPAAKIVLCADNDHQTPGNPGVTKAREAALAVGGTVAIPEFPPGHHGTDWNDYAAWKGGRYA